VFDEKQCLVIHKKDYILAMKGTQNMVYALFSGSF
jgi:hypothetical protein